MRNARVPFSAAARFSYTALHSDSPIFSVSRYFTNTTVVVSYGTSTSTYVCAGNRQP